MRATRAALLTWIGCLALLASAAAQTPVGTAFTYQGRLTDNGSPANGVYDLQFVLYTASTGGTQVGPIVIKDDVTVTSGLFTVSLDFGATAFAGDARWLEVSARPGAGGTFVPMAPRQELTPSPNAVFSQKAPWAGLSGVPAGFADGVDNDLLGGISCANGQIARWNGAAWSCAGDADHRHLGQTWTGAAGSVGLTVDNTTADGVGVLGKANAGTGSGVAGLSDSNSGYGVLGHARANTGSTAGVWGLSDSTQGRGVYGTAFANTGTTYGVFGASASNSGRGVYGYAFAGTGTTYGVYGQSDSALGHGVFGENTAGTGNAFGVYGRSVSTGARAVFGYAPATTGLGLGVYGQSDSTAGTGVEGYVPATTGTNYGVWGESLSTAGRGVYGRAPSTGSAFAGYFDGRVAVTGTLSKGGGSFKIDHPLDPENKYLYHSFVESPDMMNIYNGNVTTDQDGYAIVELPAWFEALNRDFRYQLTVIGEFAQAIVARKVDGNRFTIRTDKAGVEVSWQVTGIRKDAFAEKYRIPVEQDKPERERGLYLHPDVFGQPEEKGIDYQVSPVHRKPAQEAETEAAGPGGLLAKR